MRASAMRQSEKGRRSVTITSSRLSRHACCVQYAPRSQCGVELDECNWAMGAAWFNLRVAQFAVFW